MNGKQEILTTIQEEFDRWQGLLASLSEEQIITPQHPSHLSIKDEIAHLYVWQQRSIARLQAGLENREPQFPTWPAGLDPEADEDVDRINAWIYENHRHRSWSNIQRDWREGYLRFMALGEAIPEADLFDAKKYPWLEGYALADVLRSSYEHHHDEHLGPLLARLAPDGQND